MWHASRRQWQQQDEGSAEDGVTCGYGWRRAERVRSDARRGQEHRYAGQHRGDVIGATLNLAHGTISFSVNGIDQGVAFELPPELRSTARFHPAITIKGCAAQLNLGQAPLRHKPPFAQPFAAAGVVDELAIPQEVRGQVIGRSWATTQFDTSAHLISRETHALTQRDGGW